MGKLHPFTRMPRVSSLGAVLIAVASQASCRENARPGRSSPAALNAGGTVVTGGPQDGNRPQDGSSPPGQANPGAAARVRTEDEASGVHAGADGAPRADAEHGGAPSESAGGIVLTAVVVPFTPDGALGIAAKWENRTEQTLFLRGCATTDAWFLEGSEWRMYGPFAACLVERNTVEVAPGATYVDVAGAAVPPERGSNVWRLAGRYGLRCQRDKRFAESECAETHELSSINQITWEP